MKLSPFLTALFLAGCAALVPTTAMQLSALSPLDADPAALGLALVLPGGIAVASGGVTMVIEAAYRGGGQSLRVAAKLESRDGDAAIGHQPGDSVTLYALSAADVVRLRELQRQVAIWNAQDPGGTSGSFSLGVTACTVGGGPDSDAKGSAFVKTASGGRYFPLIDNAGLRSLIGAELYDDMAPCTPHPGFSADPFARH